MLTLCSQGLADLVGSVAARLGVSVTVILRLFKFLWAGTDHWCQWQWGHRAAPPTNLANHMQPAKCDLMCVCVVVFGVLGFVGDN